MKANELRIGNYVTLGRVIAINEITCSIQVKNGRFTNKYEFVTPIPLTEEWLVKLGYYNWGDRYTYSDKARGGVIIHKRKRGWVLRKNVPVIKYVHQLQNLYFALTGKELTI